MWKPKRCPECAEWLQTEEHDIKPFKSKGVGASKDISFSGYYVYCNACGWEGNITEDEKDWFKEFTPS